MSGIDAYLDAHPDTQRRLAGRVADADADWNALDHLDPVSAGILRRQQGKARGGRGAYAFHGAGPTLTRESIDLYRHFLSGPDIGQFGFLWTCLNPDVVGRNDVEGRRRGGKVLTGLQRP